MKVSSATIALSIAVGNTFQHAHASSSATATIIRFLQDNNQDEEDGTITVISGTGVDEADLPEQTDGVPITVPNYSDDQCSTWLSKAFAADVDSSNGLSETEFHSFVLSIEEPAYVVEYFQQFTGSYESLPWMFKVVHKTLACRCQDLGLGNECCEGDDPEIPFIGLRDGVEDMATMTPDQQAVAREYKADMCNSIAVVLQKFIPVPNPTASPLTGANPTITIGTLDPVSVGAVFQCVDEVACNANVPSLDEDSGWAAQGYCGVISASAGFEECPLSHDGDASYSVGDNVAVDVPFLGVVFECADASTCNSSGPSMDSDSGWTALGYCGIDSAIGVCPETYDASETYETGDQVSLAPDNVRPPPLVLNVVGSVIDYRTFDYDFETGSNDVPEYYNAADVLSDKDGMNILRQVIGGFGSLATEVLGSMDLGSGVTEEGKRNRNLKVKPSSSRVLQRMVTVGTLDPVVVTDVECPAGLMYAPMGGFCLNFKFKIFPQASINDDSEIANLFINLLEMSIDDLGRLYDLVVEANSDTVITGLGVPGKGINYQAQGGAVIAGATIKAQDKGLATWAIVLIILCIILIPAAIIALYVRHKKQQQKERSERLAEHEAKRDLEAGEAELPPDEPEYFTPPAPIEEEPEEEVSPEEDDESSAPAPIEEEPKEEGSPEEDDESSAPSERSESKDESSFAEQEGIHNEFGEAQPSTAGSALAAMRTMGAVVSLSPEKVKSYSESDEEDSKAEIRNEVRALVEETNSSRSVEELLEVYAGREDVLLTHLRTMKSAMASAETPAPAAPPAASPAIIAAAAASDANVPHESSAFDEELQSKIEPRKVETPPSVEIEEVKPPSHIDEELLSKIEERKQSPVAASEDEALSTSSRSGAIDKDSASSPQIDEELQARMEEMKASPTKVMEEPTSSATSTSRIDPELLSRMEQMKTKEEKDQETIREEVAALVEETNPGKTAEELLLAYEGREGDLIHSLQKLKAVKATKREII